MDVGKKEEKKKVGRHSAPRHWTAPTSRANRFHLAAIWKEEQVYLWLLELILNRVGTFAEY